MADEPSAETGRKNEGAAVKTTRDSVEEEGAPLKSRTELVEHVGAPLKKDLMEERGAPVKRTIASMEAEGEEGGEGEPEVVVRKKMRLADSDDNNSGESSKLAAPHFFYNPNKRKIKGVDIPK